MEDDAYFRLREYLKRFEDTIPDKEEAREVMEDVESRVAELFQKEMKFANQVVDMPMVQMVIDHLGDVDQMSAEEDRSSSSSAGRDQDYAKGDKRFYRDIDNKMLAGVCSGLSEYTGIDVTIIRVVFILLVFAYGSTVFVYIILWIVAPRAISVAQKLQMRGYAPTAENIRKFTSQYK